MTDEDDGPRDVFGPLSLAGQLTAALCYVLVGSGRLEEMFGTASIVFLLAFSGLGFAALAAAAVCAIVGWFRREPNPWLPLIGPVVVGVLYWKLDYVAISS